MRFILTWLTTAIAVSVAIWIVPGIGVIGDIYVSTLSTALALAFLNALIKPVVQFFALPITCLTLGLFSLVINASMLELASYLSRAIFNSGIYIMSFAQRWWEPSSSLLLLLCSVLCLIPPTSSKVTAPHQQLKH